MTDMPKIGGSSRNQRKILEALWTAHQYNPEMTISGRELTRQTNISDATRDISPLRIKLRRLGWEIETIPKKGYRLATWKGDKS